MKRILIIHYHLNPGGVTRIIESQVQALREHDPSYEILILTASCQKPDIIEQTGTKIILEEKLNYLTTQSDCNSVYKVLKQFFTGIITPDDILHIHNLNLGKNPVLTLIISELAAEGYRIINHAHDFAEDRPANYKYMKSIVRKISEKSLHEVLYPDLPNILHIVLNFSDSRRLRDYGINQDKIFVLPNPVVFPSYFQIRDRVQNRNSISKKLNLDSSKLIITYPVRVIRRKNIGEFILLCCLFSDSAAWLVTQPPKNPEEVKFYVQWKKFCKTYSIPVLFEVGDLVDFELLIMASDYCFTTSTMEGFGMVFLEPWLLGTPVIGRNIPKVTSDIKETGILFPLLYDSIDILRKGRKIDFAQLNMAEQMKFIVELVKDPEKKGDLFLRNRFLEKLLISVDQSLIDRNKAIILQEFSLEHYAKRLKTIYKKLTG